MPMSLVLGLDFRGCGLWGLGVGFWGLGFGALGFGALGFGGWVVAYLEDHRT